MKGLISGVAMIWGITPLSAQETAAKFEPSKKVCVPLCDRAEKIIMDSAEKRQFQQCLLIGFCPKVGSGGVTAEEPKK